MKRFAMALLALAVALCAGCTGSVTPAPTEAPSVTDAPTEVPVITEAPEATEAACGLVFETTDINGDPIAFSDFAGDRVIMINFWETWCGPCMGELSELESLYEQYKDRGFTLIGVCSSSGIDEIRSTVDSVGITYPVMLATESLEQYMTQYVPTTVFFSGAGELLHSEPYIGARNYKQWEKILLDFLGD